jgi:hypothetical protein
MINVISKAEFILHVERNFQRNKHVQEWKISDSVIMVMEEIDTADMPQAEWDRLFEDCNRIVGRSVTLER